MKIYKAFDLFELVGNKMPNSYRETVCKNMYKFRIEKYNEFKHIYKNEENPYSVDNIAELLNISKVHYKRLENVNDKCKYITLDKLIILSIIYDKKLDDFLKE